ncbi:MAG: crosslink repair DNA glycosylase YcaQ family protein [Opitutaceae bacterium]
MPTVGAALAHLGYVQMDPVNVCGRMHDLILRNRVAGYREDDLIRHLHGSAASAPSTDLAPPAARQAFEHYLPGLGILVALPLDAWPHLIARSHHRRNVSAGYAGKLSAAEERLARRILGELAERGPLTSDDIEHEARAQTAWGNHGRMVKTVLEKLHIHARVFIAARRNFRRVYDLPERVLPAALLRAAEPSQAETQRWLIQLRLRQRRLVPLRRAELPQVEDLVQAVTVNGCPLLYCLHEDVPLLAASIATGSLSFDGRPILLAPLDPLIYDRRLTRSLWAFDYIWEAYTPPAKRKRGHYALPVLAGTELVGHVNPRIDRQARRLRLQSRSIRRGCRLTPALGHLARFLGLKPRG